jgi:predicted CoA-substrate-specific enzyme activase
MAIYLGIDVGTVSVKVAALMDESEGKIILSRLSSDSIYYNPTSGSGISESQPIIVSRYHRIRGNPLNSTIKLLESLREILDSEQISSIRVCGSGGQLISKHLNIPYENEFRAIAQGVATCYPGISSVFEMGGQNAKFLSLQQSDENGHVGLQDYDKSGDCAAGTGSFLDQQAVRLKYRIEEIGDIVLGATRSAKIAGRCSVFAKSDMIHAQQKGYQPPEVLKGLCEAVARNFKSGILKGKRFNTPVLFIGGVAMNKGVVQAMREVFNLTEDQLIVPEYYAWLGAIGAAVAARKSASTDEPWNDSALDLENTSSFPVSKPLSMEKVLLLRDKVKPRDISGENKPVDVYMGLDIGSVSTNVVVLDDEGNMIKEIYTRTEGRPIEVVQRCLDEIQSEFAAKIIVRGVGSTGSGRELIGELVGADTINDEITAHKTGAEFLARTMLDNTPDTIFEIGGQDSKYISIEKSVVVDFAMNEACAAGTGSFLEERAEELGVNIKEEFARLALSSKAPIKLGERCTVFMQQDVAAYQQRGAGKADITAGLAYSIVYNYLNRVVRDRKIGNVIFFQGGTAYNDAIASAFASVLDREIIIPPYNGVVGAVGAALLAREKATLIGKESKFRGFDLENVDYTLREFVCKACSNFCQMQEFTVEGEKTYWGDQCSDKFRRHRDDQQKPIIDDLFSYRRRIVYL